MPIDILTLIIIPILVGGLLDVLHQLIRRWFHDKDDD
jgi:hypothetical protein